VDRLKLVLRVANSFGKPVSPVKPGFDTKPAQCIKFLQQFEFIRFQLTPPVLRPTQLLKYRIPEHCGKIMNENHRNTAWITGGTRGIGLEITKLFLKNGIKTIASGTKEEKFYRENNYFPAEFTSSGFSYRQCDVSSFIQVSDTYEKIKSDTGIPGILVNNAGIGIFKPLSEMTAEEFSEMTDVNFKGVFNTTRAVINDFIERKSGLIINITSVAAEKAFPGSSVYGASKAAVLAMARSLREEVREMGIKVVNILPGATGTEIWSDKLLEKYGERMMTPREVAEVVLSVVNLSSGTGLTFDELTLRPTGGDL
jgi:short-subunit dehydrogenase